MKKIQFLIFSLSIMLFAGFYSMAANSSYICVYDKLNRLQSVAYDNGTVITYTYDAAGNMTGTTVTAARSLQVTTPNGGQSWTVGTSQGITWTSDNLGGNVDIRLSRDGGSTWETVIADTANDGGESWLVTGPAAACCRIQVGSVTWPGIRDASDADFTVVPDVLPPDTQITSSFCGTVVAGDSVTIAWTGTDNVTSLENLQYAYRLDNGIWSDYGPATSASFSALSYTMHLVEVKARDLVNNVDPTPATCTFTAVAPDTVPPDTQITSAVCGTTIVVDSVIIEWTGTDNVTPPENLQYAYRLDSGTWSSYGSATSSSFEGLSASAHTVEVKARDTAGIEDPTPASCSFTVELPDTVPPDTQITSAVCGTTITSDSVTIDWTGADNVTATINLMYAWQLDAEGWSNYFSNTSHTFNGLTQGPHEVLVRSLDEAANVEPSPASCTFTVWLTGASGDVNNDGLTDLYDLVIMLQVAAGSLPAGQPPCLIPLAGDFNTNGSIDAADCVTMAKCLAGSLPMP